MKICLKVWDENLSKKRFGRDGDSSNKHQDRLVSGPGRVEAELGAAVVDQVELGVVAAAEKLPLPLSGTWATGLTC
jgi:hypothetical protein